MKALLAMGLLATLCAGATGPAPHPVKRSSELTGRREAIAPRLVGQPESRVIAAKTRRVLALQTSVGAVALWAAPTRGGGECWLIDIQGHRPDGGATCTPLPVRRDYVIRPWQSETRVGEASLRLLSARVTPEVASVEIEFSDGTTDEVRPTGGFFLRELQGEEEPEAVIARDAHGTELRRRSMPGPRSFRRDLPFPTAPYRRVIELQTSAGYPMTLAVAPGTNGSVCRRTIYRGAQAWGCGADPSELEPDEIGVYPGLWNENEDGKPVALLEGAVGRSISRLEVWYADRTAARIPVVEQYVLFEVPVGRVPRLLVGVDADGSLIARRPLGR
jgi:hypothetical protein